MSSISHGLSFMLELSGFMDEVRFPVPVSAGAGMEFRFAGSLMLGRGSSLIFGVGSRERGERGRQKNTNLFLSEVDYITSTYFQFLLLNNPKALIFFFKCK